MGLYFPDFLLFLCLFSIFFGKYLLDLPFFASVVLIVIEQVVLLRVFEDPVLFEFILDHFLYNNIMRKLLLQLQQFFTSLPFIFRLGKLVESFTVTFFVLIFLNLLSFFAS